MAPDWREPGELIADTLETSSSGPDAKEPWTSANAVNRPRQRRLSHYMAGAAILLDHSRAMNALASKRSRFGRLSPPLRGSRTKTIRSASEADKPRPDVDYVPPIHIHHLRRDTVEHRSQINNLGVLHSAHLTNHRYMFRVPVDTKTAGFHDRF